MDTVDAARFLLSGGLARLAYAKEGADDAVDGAEARGAPAGVVRDWRAAVEQSFDDWDISSLDAINDYASRYSAAGAFTETTTMDDVVAGGLDVATATRDWSAMIVGGFVLVVVLLLVTRR